MLAGEHNDLGYAFSEISCLLTLSQARDRKSVYSYQSSYSFMGDLASHEQGSMGEEAHYSNTRYGVELEAHLGLKGGNAEVLNIASRTQQLRVLYPQIRSTQQRHVPQLAQKTYAIFLIEGTDSFSIGMVIGDHSGVFLGGKTTRITGRISVFDAEAVGVKEALSWLYERPPAQYIVETDSLMVVQAL
ncbi:hypothetical protein AgCh_004438 [Apium graveolens]